MCSSVFSIWDIILMCPNIILYEYLSRGVETSFMEALKDDRC
jgi:hypothetical protein